MAVISKPDDRVAATLARAPTPPPRLRRACVLALAPLLALQSVPARAEPATIPLEYQVKTAFLYNFARFVEWPDHGQPGPGRVSICVLADDLFVEALRAAIAGKTVDLRPIEVRRFATAGAVEPCHILFVGAAHAVRLPRIVESLRGTPVLIVGESPRFAERGGIINFVLEDNRVRFEINLDAAQRSRLNISSKLLSLARVLYDRRESE